MPPPELEAVAELRATGVSWDAVAQRLGKRPATVRRWPKRFAADWQRLLADATRRTLTEAAAEAVAVLRHQLRGDDDKARRDAARLLLTLKPAPPTDPADPFDQLSDADLLRLANRDTGETPPPD